MQEITQKIQNFLNSRERNLWIDGDHMQIYVRKSTRFFEQQNALCLDLASISIEPEHQHKGLFKKVITTFLDLNPYPFFMIENVLNPSLYFYLDTHKKFKMLDNYPMCFVNKNKRF